MNFTKIVRADLDSPCQELSNDGLGIVVALTVFRQTQQNGYEEVMETFLAIDNGVSRAKLIEGRPSNIS